jgi:hypothetical protein
LCLSAPGRAVSLHDALISLSLALSQYNKEWEEAYEREKITATEDPNIRFVNIKALLLSYYSLFPPLTNEALKFNLVQSHEEALKMITISLY